MTLRTARALEREIGAALEWINVTEFGDAEPMVLITTPRCAYCGRLNPRDRCVTCGAPAPGAGLVW